MDRIQWGLILFSAGDIIPHQEGKADSLAQPIRFLKGTSAVSVYLKFRFRIVPSGFLHGIAMQICPCQYDTGNAKLFKVVAIAPIYEVLIQAWYRSIFQGTDLLAAYRSKASLNKKKN